MKRTLLLFSAFIFSLCASAQETRTYTTTVDDKQIVLTSTESETDFLWTVDRESFKVSKDTAAHQGIELVTERTSFLMCMALAEQACSFDWQCYIMCLNWNNPACVITAVVLCKKNPDRFGKAAE